MSYEFSNLFRLREYICRTINTLKMKKILIILILFASKSAFCQTAENSFIYVGKDKEGIEYYVLKEKDNLSTISIWIKKINPIKTIKAKNGKYKKIGGGWDLFFNEIDCNEREIFIHEINTFDANGNLLQTKKSMASYKIIPDSMGDLIRKKICQ